MFWIVGSCGSEVGNWADRVSSLLATEVSPRAGTSAEIDPWSPRSGVPADSSLGRFTVKMVDSLSRDLTARPSADEDADPFEGETGLEPPTFPGATGFDTAGLVVGVTLA